MLHPLAHRSCSCNSYPQLTNLNVAIPHPLQELLASLAAAGYALVLITNGHHLVQQQKVASCAAGRHFPHILVGGEEILAGRDEKPHPVIFDRCDVVVVSAP